MANREESVVTLEGQYGYHDKKMNVTLEQLQQAVADRITHPPRLEAGRAFVALVVTVGVALSAFWVHLNLASAISILLLATIVTSIQWGVIQGSVVSLAAVGCLDFLFTPPLFKFSVHSPENWVALATFEITALMVSRLSWKERQRAHKEERQKQAISKLYQLSNAILLVESRGSALEQLGALMREFFSVERVELWTTEEPRSLVLDSGPGSAAHSAYQVFLLGRDVDCVEEHWSHRLLRMGTSPIGGMVLQGWQVDPALADAAASLIAVAIERARSAQKENRAEAARNTEQLRTAVLDALAHGFKTPLTAIQTASSGLLAIGQLGEAQAELVEIIDHEVATLTNLTTGLLQTAALDAKAIRVRFSPVSLLPLVKGLVEQDARIQTRVFISTPASLQDVKADAPLLRLALAQVIDNAAKYSRVGTPIVVAFSQNETATTITVSNEAEPIKAEELSRIFERYYRGPQAGKGPTGTGLGLSIVKKIAEAHGGDAMAACDDNQITISLTLPGGTDSNHE